MSFDMPTINGRYTIITYHQTASQNAMRVTVDDFETGKVLYKTETQQFIDHIEARQVQTALGLKALGWQRRHADR